MDHEQRRQRQQHSPRGNAPGSGRCGTSSGKHKGGGGKGKKPIKVVYISNPMRVKTSAAGFRALVQELTGRDADPSKYSPEDLAGAADAAVAAADLDCGAAQGLSPGGAAASSETIVAIPSPAAADHLPDAAAEAAPYGGDYYDEGEDEDGFGSQLLENNYTVFSPPTLLYDHHPYSKFPFG
ncbi:hypothetical protein BDA96_03G355500 [Sorghum bicolor]|uniref:VQ domain-containing protein n=2 Tax=Sorghum bicolor TaxID=4558 RepID=A0A921RG95_SORBI|nr:uncharacterized protein LOC8055268 [Sorghum bicolor]EES01627.1 hypothetical protein SORBI_3003G329700 [Sorghum bicolor]KAG0539828.1 hypothetical protein BDA96_03G355500 [Sorghum bicolor]|eukprot:XP_002456507.1 uncharacterized protein LOC8055268 [Sorghum bicolor]